MPHPIGIHQRLFRRVREDFLFHSFSAVCCLLALFWSSALAGSSGSWLMAGLILLVYVFVVLLPDRIRWILKAPRFQALGYGRPHLSGSVSGLNYDLLIRAGSMGFKSKSLAMMRIELFTREGRDLLGPLVAATPMSPVRHFIYPDSLVFYFEFESKKLPESGLTLYPDFPNTRVLENQIAAWAQVCKNHSSR